MSGIALVLHLDGRPADGADLAPMLSEMARRGPDGEDVVLAGSVALGHRHLPTTPEALVEPMPLSDPATGCVLTGDIRLDNRDALLVDFGLSAAGGRVVGDGELVLHAWERWGEDCALHLLGDFAFAIWDPRRRSVFAARDQMGMRQLIYTQRPDRVFVCATSARAVASQPRLEPELNDLRLAEAMIDFAIGSLTSTFFKNVFRLPPAHCLTVGDKGLSVRAYWEMTPPAPLRLKSDAEYAEAFREVHAEAVRARLRGAGTVGSMMSGGIDSGSIVAQASRMVSEPLPTFSAVGPDPTACGETHAVHAMLALPNLAPTLIDHDDLGPWKDDMLAATCAIEEPWDFHMIMLRATYLAARRAGVNVLLDGAAGDVMMNHGEQMVRQIRSGQLLRAWRDARGNSAFWDAGVRDTMEQLVAATRGAFMPETVRRWRARARATAVPRLPERNVIDPDFADRVGLRQVLRDWQQSDHKSRRLSFAEQQIRVWPRSGTTVGRERYDRTAAQFGVEPRDPFMDRRLWAFCLSLPNDQFQKDGWAKMLLRRSMAGYLPDDLRWRRGRHHLGPTFTQRLVDLWPDWRARIEAARSPLEGKVPAELLDPTTWRGDPFTEKPLQLEILLGVAVVMGNTSRWAKNSSGTRQRALENVL